MLISKLTNLNSDTVIITPNQRLALHLQSQFDHKQQEANYTGWPTPKIFSLASWLENLWNNCYNDHRILLNDDQEYFLWQQNIPRFIGENVSVLINLAKTTSEIINHWQLDVATWPKHFFSEEILIFCQWFQNFLLACRANGFITHSELPQVLLTKLKQNQLRLPRKVIAVDFDQPTPIFQLFLASIANQNCDVEIINTNNCISRQSRITVEDHQLELLTMARWARQKMQLFPEAQIGCVVPNLPNQRSAVERVFNEVLGSSALFNISAGKRLLDFPIIANAIELLNLYQQKPITLQTLGKILHCPFLGDADSMRTSYARAHAKIIAANQFEFDTDEIATILSKYLDKTSYFINGLTSTERDNVRQLPSQWSKIFISKLQAFGWPGELSLSSEEYQTVNRWQELLREFSKLDLIFNNVSYSDSLKALSTITQRTIFQPKHQPTTINIYGILEASGINFDYLWVAGMDHEHWPESTQPNPFIPVAIQRKFNLPHATAKRELEFSETITNRFKASATEIIFSHPKQSDDRLLKPSPLITDITQISVANLDLASFTMRGRQIFQSQKLETIRDNFALPLSHAEKIHGGSKILELQSLCPFRAFAEFRLGATESPLCLPGISKSERGNVLHQVLEKLWQKIHSHPNLCQLSDHDLAVIIDECLKNILDAAFSRNRPAKIIDLEHQCLSKLLLQWFRIEKERPSFEVVNTEKSIEASIGKLRMKLRIDRIDKLADGSLLLIDYKTGKKIPSRSDWITARPKNLQLPIYCLAVAVDRINAVAFAKINIESMQLKKINLAESIDEITNQPLLGHLQKVLEQLAKNFVSGNAQIDPVDQETCDCCNLQLLCRHPGIIPKDSDS